MEKAIDFVPDRVRYYLLDWKDRNMKAFKEMTGKESLRELNRRQIKDLFNKVASRDSQILDS